MLWILHKANWIFIFPISAMRETFMVNWFIILTSRNHAFILQRKVISCQYNKRLICLGVHSQLEKLIMYLECFVYLMFMCVCVHVYVAVHECCIANIQKSVFDFYHIVCVGWIYVRFDSKYLKIAEFYHGHCSNIIVTITQSSKRMTILLTKRTIETCDLQSYY